MTPPVPSPADDAAEADASSWVARRDRGLTAAEQDEYLAWLRRNPEHGRTIARLENAWTELDLLTEWLPQHSKVPNPDLLARHRRGRVYWLSTAACLAAACIALAIVAFRRPPVTPLPAPLAVVAREYEQRVLEDGSVVELRSGAVVEVEYRTAERRVRLVRGEALFTVAKDPSRPFVVRAGTVDVRAVGTVFNVRLRPDAVEVLVTHGAVAVSDPGRSPAPAPTSDPPPDPAAPLLLEAGHRTVVALEPLPAAPAPAAISVSPVEVAAALAWQPKRLEFEDTPLGLVVAEFNRYNDRKLRLGDAALATLPIGGNFRSDNVEAFVRLLEASFALEADRLEQEIVLYTGRR
jgi:transmembrane sensor